MSIFTEKLLSLPGFYSLDGVTNEDVLKAEEDLGIVFAQDFRKYLMEFGVASINGHELTGICKLVRLNLVDVTKKQRKINPNISMNWYVIEQTNIDDITIWQDTDGIVYQTSPLSTADRIADSFIEYVENRCC